MRIRRARSPLLLLLLPTLAASLAVDTKAKPGSVQHLANDGAPAVSDTLSASKHDVGTKDAPVDGLDGKPHAGPFVDSQKKKLPPTIEDIPSKSLSEELSDIAKDKSFKDGWSIPEREDSVMDDREGERPKKGPTGTEGGVSEKDKERKKEEAVKGGAVTGKKPDPPKEAPPLPANDEKALKKSAKEKANGKKGDESEKEKQKGAAGLEKPADLPEKPHDIPHPGPKGGAQAGKEPPHTKKPSSKTGTSSDDSDDESSDGVIQPFHSFVLSLTMILFSEVGDKTFLIAALMAMRHARLLVFSAAFSALVAMTVLSAVLGHAVPTLLPKKLTNFAAAILFLIFGAKMLREGLAMSPEEGVGEEMKEVEMELEEKEHLARRNSRRRSSITPYLLESGRGRRSRSDSRLPAPPRSPSSSPSRSPSPNRSSFMAALDGFGNLVSLLLSPAWVQTFVMTFLGEWGDRSQIATIAMAAGQDYWWVTGGAISGHAVCTAAAVIGGRAVAGRVSLRVVTLGGAIAFLAFGIIYMAEAVYSSATGSD